VDHYNYFRVLTDIEPYLIVVWYWPVSFAFMLWVLQTKFKFKMRYTNLRWGIRGIVLPCCTFITSRILTAHIHIKLQSTTWTKHLNLLRKCFTRKTNQLNLLSLLTFHQYKKVSMRTISMLDVFLFLCYSVLCFAKILWWNLLLLVIWILVIFFQH